jgi:hypothetical protein
MVAVTLRIEGEFCGPLSVGTVSAIKVVAECLGVGLAAAKEFVDRSVFQGQVVCIPAPSIEAANRFIREMSALPSVPRMYVDLLGADLQLGEFERTHSAAELLVRLVWERDRHELQQRGVVDDFPVNSVWINFVEPAQHGEGGRYFHEHVTVDIYRHGCPSSPGRALTEAERSPRPCEELVWLAHELGHHESTLAGFVPPTESSQPFPRYEEELRAWLLARRLLDGQRFVEWPQFEAIRNAALVTYRGGLAISETDAVLLEVNVTRQLDGTG